MLYNDAYAGFAGGRHPELLGSRVREGWPEVADFNDNVMRVVLAGGTLAYRNEELTLYRHGVPEQVWMNLDYSPVLDEGGTPVGVICILAETTEGVAAERTRQAAVTLLRANEARLGFLDRLAAATAGLADADSLLETTTRLLGEHLNLAVCAYADMDEDQDGFTIRGDWSAPGSKSIVGHYRLADFGTLALKNLSAGRPLVVNDNLRELAPEEAATFQNIGIAATICMPLVKQGRLIALMAVHDRVPRYWTDEELDLLREVTARSWAHIERVAATAELRASEARFRLMADAVPQIVWIADAAGRAEFFNKQWSDYTGLSHAPTTAAEVAANHIHPDDAAATIAAFDEARRTGSTFLVEHRIRSRTGGYRWFLVRGEPYREPGTDDITRWFGTSVDIHDRRQAEAALRESEERYRQIVEGAEDFAIITLDERGVITSWNSGAERMMGLSEREAVGQRGDIFFTPEDRAAGKPGDEMERADRRGRALNERWHLRKDGSRFWGSGLIMPLEGNAGYLKIFRDRTAEHEAEAAMRESEARLRLVQAAGGIGSFDYDLQKDEAICSPEFHAILGLPDGHPVNLATWTAAIHPDDANETMKAFQRAVADRAPFAFEYRIVRADNGEVRWLSGRAAVLFDGENRPWRYVGGNIDVTDHKALEERLRVLNETLEQRVAERTAERDRMWESSPDLMLVIGFDGIVQRVNPAWTTLLGYAPEELVGHHVNAFMDSDDNDNALNANENAAAGGGPRIVNRYRHKDGSVRWISWVAAPAGGATYATGRDVTAEKERAAELLEAQEQLRQSQKMEAMGQLTGGVAHDFNNLLTPIVGSLDMLVRRAVGSERERRLIEAALQSAERAKTLVQRLLAFARRQPLQPTSVDVGRLVEGMAGLIGSTLGPKIDVQVALADDLPHAMADANQLEMAVLNLAVNARDAMPRGGKLLISACPERVHGDREPSLEPGDYVQIRVTDTGVGMDRATRERAVEPFFSTKGVGKGTGLGLSMVHGLAAQLGGGMRIVSAPDEGTTIELWLPASTRSSRAGDHAAVASPARRGRGTVLLVDDEDLVRMSTAEMLIDLGFEVLEAGSAEEALKLVRAVPTLDLLVTDHLMPGMSGTELVHEARTLKPALPVLVVSGYAEVESIAPDLPRLSKPFRNSELAAVLSTLIPVSG